MTAQDIMNAISSVGFPIVAYAGLFWYMYKQDKQHEEESKELREVIEKNTLVVQHLSDKIETIGGGVENE